MKKKLLIFFVILAITLILWSVRNKLIPDLEMQRRFMMDTFVTVYADGPKKITSAAIDLAFDVMQQLTAKLNAHNPESPIYAFNHKNIPIRDRDILEVVRVAQEVSRKSEGAFDITVYPLLKLWGFYERSWHMPGEQEIKECLKNIGYKHLLLTNEELRSNQQNVAIDLGAIAKGYVIAKGIEVLKQAGITSALIDAGGDVYALGKKRGKPWKIGIQHPRKVGLLGYVEVSNTAVMGSGDYQRFFMKRGKRYHHIFNPHTGYPAEELSGITVVYPDPVLADAWATALFVLGLEKGMKVARDIMNLEVAMVTAQGKVLYSSGFKQLAKEIK